MITSLAQRLLQFAVVAVVAVPAAASSDLGPADSTPSSVAREVGTSNSPEKQRSCDDGTRVHTEKGPVCGFVDNGLKFWKGMPYAAPPVGRLRWAPPRTHEEWTEVLRATEPGPLCPQPGFGSPPQTNEDCLYLRVTAPADSEKPLPVMVHFHGGGFTYFGPSDGSHLVRVGNVVHVGVNYRLGIMGFFSHAALGPHSGNYALEDQQAALRWVRRNIARFGGNPNNVTIYGASAGGSSVCAQMVSPAAQGLFDKGISQNGFYNALSNGKNTLWQPQDCMADLPTAAEAHRAGALFAAAVGCGETEVEDVAACLRDVPVAKLLEQAGNGLGPASGTIAPIVDGKTLPLSPGEAFKKGRFNRGVSLIMGVARDETQTGLSAGSPREYRTLVRQQYGVAADEVLARYPLRSFPSPFIAFRTVTADSLSVCPAYLTERRIARWNPVYAYQFENADAPLLSFLDPSKPNGAYHVGANVFLRGRPDLNANQDVLNTVIPKMWTAFAHGGDPTTQGTPYWPAVARGQHVVMQLRPAGDSELDTDIPMNHHCEFWKRLVAYPVG